jgi:hypothetical protein
MNVVTATKRYVADDRYRLRLFDTIVVEIRRVLGTLADTRYSVTAAWSEEEFRKRITVFDELFADLCRVEALMACWGGHGGGKTLTLPIKRICDHLERGGGNTGWLAIQWYPVLMLLYAGGIAAVAAGRHDALKELLNAPVLADRGHEPLAVAVTSGVNDKTRAFQLLPDLERHYTPCSDHLHDVLRPLLDEMLFVGSDYERAFDRLEILYALEYAHHADRTWAPVGRFGWKARDDGDPLQRMIAEAAAAGETWAPLVAGLCGGSLERFNALAQVLQEQVARTARW